MEKNTILFVASSIAFLLLWYRFFPPQAPIPISQKPQVLAQTPQAPASELKGLKKSGKVVPIEQTQETLETEYAKVVMDSQGAGIQHWWVKEGRRSVDLVNDPQSPPLVTFPDVNFAQVKGTQPNEAEWSAF